MKKTHIAIAFVIVLSGVGAWLFFSQSSRQAPDVQTAATSSVAAGALQSTDAIGSIASTTEQSLDKRVIPAGMREYRSTAYNFSLFYPQGLAVSEHPEGGGAATITFQNVATVEGFQIFIVPYAEPHVSEARFKQDEPSGVRNSVSNVVIDGTAGAAFYSTNLALGETREVWFVRGGFLYELTTLKSTEAWFRDILQTWKFITTP